MAEENINIDVNEGEEKEIDLLELAMTLWKQRGKLIKWSFIGALIGLVVAFSIPKEYNASATLAPEITDNKPSGGGLSALASMAGISTAMNYSVDAVYPMLYPDVVASVPFLTGLFDVKVTTMGKDDEKGKTLTLQQYMEDEMSSPWWNAILKAPGMLISLFKDKEEVDPNHKLDNFQLTFDENQLVESLGKRVTAAVDDKTLVVTINVKMQDPIVSAILADTVVSRLQNYITQYRTNKSRVDLEYVQKLNEEAKNNYYQAQQRYADYLDRNQSIAFHSAQTIRDRLENEATLAFNLYNQTSQQVQKAQAKVQENTPVYAVINPPTVPVKPTGPRKIIILIGFTFLAFVASAAWILYVAPMIKEQKEKRKNEEKLQHEA